MERKQVARKSYADPHKRQKVAHSTSEANNIDEEEKLPETPVSDIISLDEDSNEEPVKSSDDTTKKAPDAEEEPTSTNDEQAKPDAVEPENCVESSVQNGDVDADVIESSEVTSGAADSAAAVKQSLEEHTDPDSTTNTSLTAAATTTPVVETTTTTTLDEAVKVTDNPAAEASTTATIVD